MEANNEYDRSPRDYVLTPWFRVIIWLLSWTALRLLLASTLFPVYFCVKLITILPHAIARSGLVLFRQGRNHLVQLADFYRQEEQRRAAQQADGTFVFKGTQILRSEIDAKPLNIAWKPKTERFSVCGAWVNVLHEKPQDGRERSGKTVVLLHGNPSWSFMWRNVIQPWKREPRFLRFLLSDGCCRSYRSS